MSANQGRTLYPRGQCTQAWQALSQALTIARTVDAVAYQSLSLSASGILKGWEGEYAEASRFLSEGLQIAQEHHLIFPLLYSYCFYGVSLTSKGNYDEAFATFEAGLALSEKVSSENWYLKTLNSFGWLCMEVGHLDHAINPNQRSAQQAKKRGDSETVANAELNLADIFISKGDLSVAQEFLDGVYRLVKHPATSDWMKWRYSTHLFVSLGELWLARGDLNRAEAFADQCLEIATRTNSRKYMVKGWRLKGQIACARQQWDAAEGWLRQALPLAQTVGNPTQIWKTYLALGGFHTEAKRPEQARQAYQAAREVIDRVKANLQTPELSGGLQQSPVVQQVYDLSGPA